MPDLTDGLAAYFALRQEQERGRVDAVLAAMTKRECALVREVAVMAGVRATMRAGGVTADRVPKDSVVLADAISACLHMEDLYPVVARLERVAARRRRAADA